MILVTLVDYRVFRDWSPFLYGATLFTLLVC